MIEFKIIEDKYPVEFEKKVNAALAEGWQLHGFTFVHQYPDATDGDWPTWEYTQAMTREKSE